MYHEMKIFGFALDAIAQMPVIILKDTAGENSVPIWISTQESVSLAVELIGRDISSRSGRSDLLTALMQRIGMRIETIAIESLRDGVFGASVKFGGRSRKHSVGVSVGEAMMAALKYHLPVMVHEDVVKQAPTFDLNEGRLSREYDASRFVDFLENLDPAAMGKYPM